MQENDEPMQVQTAISILTTARKRKPIAGAMCTTHHHSSLHGTVTLCLMKQTYLMLQLKTGFKQHRMHINTYK